MSELERAQLIPVSGTNDTPNLEEAIDVQFNPVTLRVSLSNTLKANQNHDSSRASQFVDKSSSTLTVELIFDTSYVEAADTSSADQGDPEAGNSRNRIEQGSDVREQTKKIADSFIKPVEGGSQMQAPNRCLFQWGAFSFIGMVQTYDETLDFFSPKGRPLRATLSLKLSEDRYQFRSRDSAALAADQTPELSFTGAGSPGEAPGGRGGGQGASPVAGISADGVGSWRANAMFNGIESPRMPSMSALALPKVGIEAGVSLGGAFAGSVSLSAQVSLGSSAAGGSATVAPIPPAFRFGNSASLGTRIPGAFSPGPAAGGLGAAALQQGSLSLRGSVSPRPPGKRPRDGGTGF